MVWKIIAIQWPFYIKSKTWQLKFLFSARSVIYIDISDKTLNFIIKWISGARVLTSETLSKSCISWIYLNNIHLKILRSYTLINVTFISVFWWWYLKGPRSGFPQNKGWSFIYWLTLIFRNEGTGIYLARKDWILSVSLLTTVLNTGVQTTEDWRIRESKFLRIFVYFVYQLRS